jgi:hypothetical protein
MASLTRRELAVLAAAALAGNSAHAQISSGPGVKAKQILVKDLKGFSLQMTRLTLLDVAPGSKIPWHYHPAAQEIVFGLDGVLRMELDPPAIAHPSRYTSYATARRFEPGPCAAYSQHHR